MDEHKDTKSSPVFAIISLVLGLIALPLSFFVIGGFAGVLGAAFGFAHLKSQSGYRRVAWFGSTLSGISIAFALLMFFVWNDFRDQLDSLEAQQKWAVWERVIAPELTVTTSDGGDVLLSELRGRRVVVNVWSTSSEDCIKFAAHLRQLTDEISSDELAVVGISADAEQAVREFVEAHRIGYPVAAEVKDLSRPYDGVIVYPTTFFIDRNGVIQTIVEGYASAESIRRLATEADVRGQPLSEPRDTTSIFLEDRPRSE